MFGFGSKNSAFPQSKLIPIIIQLGNYLKQGFDHNVEIQAAGKLIDVDTLSVFLELQMKDWNPKINDKGLLDIHTKKAAARFIAGVACNLTKKELEDANTEEL